MSLRVMTGTDFCCFSTFEIELSGQGLMQLTAENHSTRASDNNGAGKTSLFKAVTWCLWGKTLDGKEADEVIRDGTKKAAVSMTLEHGGELWTAVRERRKGKPSLKLLNSAGVPFEGSTDDVQSKITAMVGLDFKAFCSTALYGQQDPMRFADPRTKDGDRKAMLHRILGTDVLQDCAKEARVQAKELQKQIDVTVAAMTAVESRASEHDVATIQQEHDEWETSRAQHIRIEVNLAKNLQATAVEYRASASELPALEERLAVLEVGPGGDEWDVTAQEHAESARALRVMLGSKTAAVNIFQTAVRKAESELRALAGETCPMCTGPLTTGPGSTHKADCQKALGVAKRELTAATLARDAVQRDLTQSEAHEDEARAEARDARQREKEAAALRQEVQAAQHAEQRAQDVQAQAKVAVERGKRWKQSVNPHLERLTAAREKVTAYADELATLQEQKTFQEEEMAHLQFWVRGFSAQGLPSYVLDNVMPYLTERANFYLDILADGDISVTFSTQRELKGGNGDVRDEITITWDILGRTGYTPSHAQQKKIDIATDLALMDLVATREGAQVDILFFDEVLDGIDAAGRARVVDLLQHLRSVRSSVFVISHEPDVAEIFERAAVVVMDATGVSTLEVRA